MSKEFFEQSSPVLEVHDNDVDAFNEVYVENLGQTLEEKSVFDLDDEWEILSIHQSDQWEIIPDHYSVESFDTFQFTYKDMLLMRKATPTRGERSIIEKRSLTFLKYSTKDSLFSCDELENNEKEEEMATNEYSTGSYYGDPFFHWDGYKNARGGKSSCMFNTNQRNGRRHHPCRVLSLRDARRKKRHTLKTAVGTIMNTM